MLLIYHAPTLSPPRTLRAQSSFKGKYRHVHTLLRGSTRRGPKLRASTLSGLAMIPVAQPAVVLDATWQVPYLRSIWGCWRAGFTHFLRRNIPNANVRCLSPQDVRLRPTHLGNRLPTPQRRLTQPQPTSVEAGDILLCPPELGLRTRVHPTLCVLVC